jgi:hypothetical protein
MLRGFQHFMGCHRRPNVCRDQQHKQTAPPFVQFKSPSATLWRLFLISCPLSDAKERLVEKCSNPDGVSRKVGCGAQRNAEEVGKRGSILRSEYACSAGLSTRWGREVMQFASAIACVLLTSHLAAYKCDLFFFFFFYWHRLLVIQIC